MRVCVIWCIIRKSRLFNLNFYQLLLFLTKKLKTLGWSCTFIAYSCIFCLFLDTNFSNDNPLCLHQYRDFFDNNNNFPLIIIKHKTHFVPKLIRLNTLYQNILICYVHTNECNFDTKKKTLIRQANLDLRII